MSFPRYPAYKDSGEAWIGEVPADWQVLRLRFAASLNPSKQETSHLPPETLVTFLPMEAVGEDGSIDLSRERPLSEVLEGYTYLRDGDIAFAKITPCFENGKGALMRSLRDGIGFGTTELTVMRPREERTVAEFLNYWIASRTFRQIGEAHMYGAGGQKRVPESMVRDFRVPLPSLPEQRAIAAFLDRETAKIDALVAEQRRLMDLLREQRQAVISHAVTKGLNPDAPMKDSGVEWLGDVPAHWKVGKIGFYTKILSGFAFPSTGFSDDSSQTRLLRGINVGVSTLKWDDTVYWIREEGDGLSEYELEPGDLVIGMDRPLISEGMRVALVKAEDTPCLLLQRVASLRTADSLSVRFLQFLLSSPMFVAHFAPETTGVSVPHISPQQIGNFVAAIPPREEQDEIFARIDRTCSDYDSLIDAAAKSIDLLAERRAALVTAAVTGQIDVRDLALSEAA